MTGKMEDRTYEIDLSSLADRAYRHIKDLVLSGELKGGEPISERALASRFGLSRTPLREALSRLEQYGLIESRPRSSARVVSLAPEEATDVAVVRVALEAVGARALVERGTLEDLDALSHIAEKCEDALKRGDVAESFEHDSEFHIEIARRCGNRHLFDQYKRLDAKVQLLRLVLHLPHQSLLGFVEQHWSLLEAIKLRDAETAVRVMERHVLGQLKSHPLVQERATHS
jgi:GntR family transcriptional regulator, rspAB operon transcriptional repressor